MTKSYNIFLICIVLSITTLHCYHVKFEIKIQLVHGETKKINYVIG